MGIVGESDLKIHGFKERLEYSEKAGHEDFWQAVYKRAFPNMLFAKLCIGKCQGQYLGIDRIIQLSSGKTLYIDEKKREKVYNDILLEYISVDRTNTPGWIEKDLNIDYLAYAFMPIKKCYLFPWSLLKRSWRVCGSRWKERYGKTIARNKDYNTISVAVPINEILEKINRAILVQL